MTSQRGLARLAGILLTSAAAITVASSASAADQVLSGTIASASGEKAA